MVECPNPKLANKLSEFLETEPVNQVGSFVTSYLRNLRSSSNPDKEHLRDVLYNVKPRKKFPFDVRKFSRNHEFSYNFDALSTSASVESNVLFSQKSYLPRSVNLNLTTEVFGHAFNLFELNVRGENLERAYEKYFGPKGYFSTHKPMEVVRDATHVYKEVRDRVKDKYSNFVSRSRRSVSRADTDNFASKVKLYNSKLDYNVDLDLSLRVLGNELSWVNVEDVETPFTPNEVVDKLSHFVESNLGKVKDLNKDYKNHFHFLDTQLTYPTSMGLPIRLNAVGSGALYLKFNVNCDVASFMKDPKNGQAKFELVPSASVDVTGEFSVDGYAVEAGVKVSGNLHSSTGSEVSLKMLDGHGFDLNVGLPVKKSDLLTVNTDVFSFVREQGQVGTEHALEFNVPRKDYHGCFDQLQSLVGLTFCGDVGFPSDQKTLVSGAANYPLNGHSKVSLRIEKEDETLTSYHARFFFDLANPQNRRVEFKLDTPGTKVPREISLLAALTTQPEKAVDFRFVSPLHRVSAKGALTNNDHEYTISGFARLDDAHEYKARVGFLKNGQVFKPILEYTPVGGVPTDVKVEGEVLVEKGGDNHRRFTFRGLRILHPSRTYTVDGTVETEKTFCKADLNVGYNEHTAHVKTDILVDRSLKHVKVDGALSTTQYPEFNFALNYEYKKEDHQVSPFVFTK